MMKGPVATSFAGTLSGAIATAFHAAQQAEQTS